MGLVQIQFTVDDQAVADGIVDALLGDHLVACGQRLGPVTSRYWWNGVLTESTEWLVLLKTRAELSARAVESVIARHPYDTPEVLVVEMGGAPAYLDWVDDVTVGTT